MKALTHLLIIILASSLAGCVYVHDKRPESETTYLSPAFGNKAIRDIDFVKGTAKGITSEQSSMADAFAGVYAAGVAAGAKGAKP